MSNSPQYSLNWLDIQKIGKGLLIAVGGTTVTYLLAIIPNFNLGQYAFVIFPVASSLLNLALKFFAGEPKV